MHLIIMDKTGKSGNRAAESRKVKTGISEFDYSVGGGIVPGSAILVRGGTGTGKTIFCLQYLYNGIKKYGQAGVFLSFNEPKDTIYHHAAQFGWDFKKFENSKFAFIKYAPHEVEKVMAEGGGTIRDTIESIGATRLVIDSLTAYSILFENEYRADQSILNLFELLRSWNCTTMVTSEKSVDPNVQDSERLGFLTDGIVNFYHMRKKTKRHRAFEIVKMRDTRHSDSLYDFSITSNGLTVL